jgi:hypothetical protein
MNRTQPRRRGGPLHIAAPRSAGAESLAHGTEAGTLLMKLSSLTMVLLLLLTASGVAVAKSRNVTDPDIPRELPASGQVSVRWTDPADFSDLRFSGNRWEAERGNWVVDLARYLQTRAPGHLAEGQQLQVTITDITRAGTYLPVAGARLDNNIRIIKEQYPPRISLSFRLLDGQGAVLSEGERSLRDSGFLSSAGTGNTDVLRYEKRMLDDWLRREFGASGN